MHSLEIVQWDSTRRDQPGYPGRVSGSGLVTKHKKNGCKNGCNFRIENVSCIVCIKRNVTKFSAFQKQTNSFTNKTNNYTKGN